MFVEAPAAIEVKSQVLYTGPNLDPGVTYPEAELWEGVVPEVRETIRSRSCGRPPLSPVSNPNPNLFLCVGKILYR